MQIKLVLICFVERKYLLERYDLVRTLPQRNLFIFVLSSVSIVLIESEGQV